jgi:uncharacterized membrane protein
MGNLKWIIQRHWQHLARNDTVRIQIKGKKQTNKKHNKTQKTKKEFHQKLQIVAHNVYN